MTSDPPSSLLLRPPRAAEAELYAEWWSDPEVQWGFCAEPRSADQIRSALPELESEARSAGHWTELVIEVDGRPVGSVWVSHWDLDSASCELNILIGSPADRGRGIGSRALTLFARWAFPRMGLRRALLCPRDDHYPAIRAYRRLGAALGDIAPDVMTWRGEVACFREMELSLEMLPATHPGDRLLGEYRPNEPGPREAAKEN